MIVLLSLVLGLSILLTASIRKYALHKNIVDVPNHRSSHMNTTPRGGGLSFVILFLSMIPILYQMGYFSLVTAIGIGLPALLIASVGMYDDYSHIPAKMRLSVHFCASMIALFFLGGLSSFSIFSWLIPTGFLANGLAVIYLVWLINLYNFMDGIDGLAGMQAVSVCLSAACLYWLVGQPDHMILPLTLAATVSGFLYWNFPPAKIFMGDVGSGFLGFIVGLLSILAMKTDECLFWSWCILLGVFIVDATVTLLQRLFSGEKVYEAHCTHAYQHASRFYNSHLRVTIIILAINVIWLFPMAYLVATKIIHNPLMGLFISYLPLLVLAIRFKAGKKRSFSTLANGTSVLAE